MSTKMSVALLAFGSMVAACGSADAGGADAMSVPEINAAKPKEPGNPASPPESSTTCAYDPDSGKDNLFGMRAFVTISSTKTGVVARFEQFPSPTGLPPIKATIASERLLTFHSGDVDAARALLRSRADLWNDLLGDAAGLGSFADWEATSKCAQGNEPAAPAPPEPLCSYDPESGYPNPLAMRTFFFIAESDGAFKVTYELLPSNLGDVTTPVTIASQRTLSIYDMKDVAAARAALLDPAGHLADEVLADSGVSYSDVDRTLKCK